MSTTQEVSDRKKLLSEDEVNDVEGKMRSLEILLGHPRQNLPELQPMIKNLWEYFGAIRLCKSLPFTQKDREKFEMGIAKVKLIEDLIIRVVLRGESLVDVLAERKARSLE